MKTNETIAYLRKQWVVNIPVFSVAILIFAEFGKDIKQILSNQVSEVMFKWWKNDPQFKLHVSSAARYAMFWWNRSGKDNRLWLDCMDKIHQTVETAEVRLVQRKSNSVSEPRTRGDDRNEVGWGTAATVMSELNRHQEALCRSFSRIGNFTSIRARYRVIRQFADADQHSGQFMSERTFLDFMQGRRMIALDPDHVAVIRMFIDKHERDGEDILDMIEDGNEEGSDDQDDVVSIESIAMVTQATAQHLFNRVMPSSGVVGNYVSLIRRYRSSWKTELNHRAKIAPRFLIDKVEEQCKNVLNSYEEQWAFATTEYLDQFRCDSEHFGGRVRGGLVDDYGGRLIVGLNEHDPDSWLNRYSFSDEVTFESDHMRRAVELCVASFPVELVPRADDTKETFFERISESTYFDEYFMTRNQSMQNLNIASRQGR